MTITDKAKKLIELDAKRTQGEWLVEDDGFWSVTQENTFSIVSKETDEDGDRELITREKGSLENVEFIAHVANNAADIAKAYLELEDKLKRYEEALGSIEEYWNLAPESAVDAAEFARETAREALKEVGEL